MCEVVTVCNIEQVVNIYSKHAASMYQTSRFGRTLMDHCSAQGMQTLFPLVPSIFIPPRLVALLKLKEALGRHFGTGESDGPTVKAKYDVDNLSEFFLSWGEVFPWLTPEDEAPESLEMVGHIYDLLARLVGSRAQAQLFVDSNNRKVHELWEALNSTGVLHGAQPSSQRIVRLEGVYAAVSACCLPNACDLAVSYLNSHPEARSVLPFLNVCERILTAVIPGFSDWHMDPDEGVFVDMDRAKHTEIPSNFAPIADVDADVETLLRAVRDSTLACAVSRDQANHEFVADLLKRHGDPNFKLTVAFVVDVYYQLLSKLLLTNIEPHTPKVGGSKKSEHHLLYKSIKCLSLVNGTRNDRKTGDELCSLLALVYGLLYLRHGSMPTDRRAEPTMLVGVPQPALWFMRGSDEYRYLMRAFLDLELEPRQLPRLSLFDADHLEVGDTLYPPCNPDSKEVKQLTGKLQAFEVLVEVPSRYTLTRKPGIYRVQVISVAPGINEAAVPKFDPKLTCTARIASRFNLDTILTFSLELHNGQIWVCSNQRFKCSVERPVE